jgi:predicted transcriptional regulator
MSNTITIRLPTDLAEWLQRTAKKTGVPKGRIIRDQLEQARAAQEKPFMRFAGTVRGPRDLSQREGFGKR